MNGCDVVLNWHLAGRNELQMTVKAVMKHEDEFERKAVIVGADEVKKARVRLLLCHGICGVVIVAFDEADGVYNLVVNLLSASIHHFRHAWGCRIH